MPPIQAIETRYAGCRFRSRLEARWAVFFDQLGIPWEYEPEGYVLGPGDLYLPDFWLSDQRSYFEVKGRADEAECAKVERFGQHLGFDTRAFIAIGQLANVAELHSWGWDRETGQCRGDGIHLAGPYTESRYGWCVVGDDYDIQYEAGTNIGHWGDDSAIVEAYAAARASRFEHGERGAA